MRLLALLQLPLLEEVEKAMEVVLLLTCQPLAALYSRRVKDMTKLVRRTGQCTGTILMDERETTKM